MKTKILILISFLLVLPAYGATDPKIAQFLMAMNKYYYSLARQGVSSLQATVNATITTQGRTSPPIRMHFSYLGAGLAPVISTSIRDNAPPKIRAAIISITNVAGQFVRTWGLFATSELFVPPDSRSTYDFEKTSSGGFTVSYVRGKTRSKIWFDDQRLAKWIQITGPHGIETTKLGFTPSADGPVLEDLEIVDDPGKKNVGVACKIQSAIQEGLMLPTTLSIHMPSPKGDVDMMLTFSNYQLHRKNQALGNTEFQDYRVIPRESEESGSKHFLWKVTSPTATVYFLGSVHIRSEEPLLVPQVVDDAYRGADYVGFETDLSHMDSMKKEMAAYFVKNNLYPAGDDLTKHLSPQEWALVRAAALQDGMNLGFAVKLRPMFLENTIVNLNFQKAGMDPMMGIDMIFQRRAQRDQKPVFGLEYWWKPFDAMNQMDDKVQARLLVGSILGSRNEIQYLKDVLRYWTLGDTEKLYEKTTYNMSPESIKEQNLILKDRNEQWLHQIGKMLATHKTFFVIVGSAHLLGPTGLPNWLQAQGYKVEQL